jgi:phytanoyl-CoA hydroxylase
MLKRFSVQDDVSAFYREHGFVIFSDLFDARDIAQTRDDVLALFERRFESINGGGATGLDLVNAYYASHKTLWRQCAQRMWDILSVYELAVRPGVRDTLRRLGLAAPIISTRPEVRTDMPGDSHYMQPWHQDWRYGQGSVNSVTFWLPFQDVDIENGTIDVMPGSHLLGYLEVEELKDPRRFSIVDPRIEELPYEPVVMELGEVIVFSQLLVHRSGFNRSGLPRLTMQMRFTDSAEPRFLENGFPAPATSELLWDHPPTAAEVGRVLGAG